MNGSKRNLYEYNILVRENFMYKNNYYAYDDVWYDMHNICAYFKSLNIRVYHIIYDYAHAYVSI